MSLMSVVLVVAIVHPALAQIRGIASPQAPTPPAQVTDPLGRTTPRGTITGFTEAVHRGDLVGAARYMQLSTSQIANAATLARSLSELMDRHLSQAPTTINASPEGALDDGLPLDRERVGPLEMDDQRVDVGLVRVTDATAGPIWLISSETLARVPALRRSIRATWVERVMPATLVRHSVFGISFAQWIVLIAALVIPLVTLWFLSGLLMGIARRVVTAPQRRTRLESWYASIRWPAIILITLLINFSNVPRMGLPLTFRIRYGRLGLVALVITVAWLGRGLLTLSFERARSMIWGRDRTSARSLTILVERLLKAVVIVVAIVAVLSILGVDTKTALAGVGIGGVAIALGAQKTVENLLGGVFLLSDRALAVGDTCSISNRLGTVEDITLRSVRMRTLEQTLLSIPAGVLSQSSVENFATRGKILIQTKLLLRYGTSAEQLRSILVGIRRLVAENPEIENSSSRVRLVDFGDRAVEIEFFAYVLTSDFMQFVAVREDILLRIATIVESSGSGFAQPTQFIYMDRKHEPVVEGPVREPVARDDVRLAQPSATQPATTGPWPRG